MPKKIIISLSLLFSSFALKAHDSIESNAKEENIRMGICVIDFGEFRECRGLESWVLKKDNKIIQCYNYHTADSPLKIEEAAKAKSLANAMALKLESNGLCLYIGEFQN